MLRGRRIMETLAEVHERKKNKRHAAIVQEIKNTNKRKILTTNHHDALRERKDNSQKKNTSKEEKGDQEEGEEETSDKTASLTAITLHNKILSKK